MGYLAVAAVVLGVNLLPAFGPPTWSILVLFRLRSGLNPVALVVVGAGAAALGRFLLAQICRRLRTRLSRRHMANLAAAREALTSSRRRSLLGLVLFAVSPISSAQLFVAAGLMNVALCPLVLVFFCGRLVSYSIYVGSASAVKNTNFGRLVASSFTSPIGVIIQLLLLSGVVLLARVDWARRLGVSRPE